MTPIGRTIAQRIAAHIVGAHEPDAELVGLIDSFVIDYLGVTVGGVDRESAAVARRAGGLAGSLAPVADELRPSCVHGSGSWAAPEEAALINGITAHGLELDDTHERASMHPAVAVMPAVFAYADAHEVDLGAVRCAIAVGYDAMTAVGTLVGAAESYGRGFHPTGVCGAIGAAAAAVALLMGLDGEASAHAVSLAANMSAGGLEFLSDGSWTKRLNAGHAAATGIRAARLAAAGFLGPARAFEGRDGFLRLYGDGAPADRELELEFGRGVRDTSVKLYPCCRYMHGNIDLLRGIHDEFPDLELDQVDAIECAVISAGAALVSEPAERKLSVTSPVDAQFNMPFGAAVALTTGRAEVAQFDEAVENARELDGWIRKVACYESPRLEAAYPGSWQAEVRLRFVDGRVIERYSEAYLGSPGRRATRADILAKAAGLVGEDWAGEVDRRLAALGAGDRFTSTALLGEGGVGSQP